MFSMTVDSALSQKIVCVRKDEFPARKFCPIILTRTIITSDALPEQQQHFVAGAGAVTGRSPSPRTSGQQLRLRR